MTQEFVTLPREIVEQAIYALEQPQGEQEPAAEHKLKDVRCECCGYMTHHREHMGCIRAAHTKRGPLADQQIDAIAESMPGGLDGFLKGWGWRQFARAVLEAAPQPPTTEQSSAVQQPQDDQEPVAWMYDWDADGELVRDWVSRDYGEAHSPTNGCCNIRPLYTHPQPKREPLTDDDVERLWYQNRGGLWYKNQGISLRFARAIEAAHNIK